MPPRLGGRGDADADTERGDHRCRHVWHLHGGQTAGRRHRHLHRSSSRPTRSAAPGATTPIPGLNCDVPSRFYSYSFRPNPEWSRLHAARRRRSTSYFRQVADRARHPRRTSDSAPRSPPREYARSQWWMIDRSGRGGLRHPGHRDRGAAGARAIRTSRGWTRSPARRSTHPAGIIRFRCRTSGSG